MADKIVSIDPIMAAFRAITAEEEAASGLMHCLKERDYKNAGKLDPRSHVHKNAVPPFVDSLGIFFAETLNDTIDGKKLLIDETGVEPRLIINLHIKGTPKNHWLSPIPPLNFSVSVDGRKVSYKAQMAQLATSRNADSILTYIRQQANTRNKLLYASPEGYPSDIVLGKQHLRNRTSHVFALVRAFLLIQPYREPLQFVQDTLNAFLAMLGVLKEHQLYDEL